MTRFLPAAGASAVVAWVLVTQPLEGLARGLALGLLVVAWLAPLVFSRRAVGAHGSMVAATAAVTAAGQVRGGYSYGIACAVFLLVAVGSLRRARTAGRPPPPRPRSVVTLIGVAAAVGALFVLGLPPLQARVERRMNDLFGSYAEEETAFSTRMHLGATTGMLQRSTVVMHVEGPAPDYLRGAVYDRYESASWVTSYRGRESKAIDAAPGERPSRIVLARGTGDGADMRWFLPPDACDLATSNESVAVDAFGVARRAPEEAPATIRFRTTGCAPLPLAAPGPNDVDVPSWLRPQLMALGDSWTAGATTPRAKLDAIVHHLASFGYSLEVPRTSHVDPVIDFLTIHRAGHCEYFASALVLLARTQGIPARVVGGYHVSEVNPLTGLAVVRERNAHSWSEAWVDGAWRAWDPTPVVDGPRPRASLLDDVTDLLALKWTALVALLDRVGPLGILAIGVAIAGLWFFVRRVRMHARDERHARARTVFEPPLPCFDRLASALARVGLAREESEPLETFAARLRGRTEPWAGDVSAAIATYAALRYGGIGDGTRVEQTLDRVARAVGATRAVTGLSDPSRG